jgi:hypothetical protein
LSSALPLRRQPAAWDRGAEFASFWSFHEREGLPAFAWRERRASLPVGLEARSPFWDLRVIELIARMPGWVHRSAGRPKALLREAMRKCLPLTVLERRDKGVFDDLMNRGLIEHETERVLAALDGPLAELLYLDIDVLRAEYGRYRSAPHRWWHALWRSISGGIWLQREHLSRRSSGQVSFRPRLTLLEAAGAPPQLAAPGVGQP